MELSVCVLKARHRLTYGRRSVMAECRKCVREAPVEVEMGGELAREGEEVMGK